GYWLKSAAEALAIAREIGWGSGQAFAHFTLSVVTGTHGQLGRALDHAESAMICARRVGHLQWTVAAHFALAWTWAELRALDRAIAALEE
ncbi:hypothetical protein, partial [Salmonella sp. SAL4447]|uniref:hypothetical protein n=1 Tax=Salmonella sp. SAL4447 TaxID=3159902 RepID=UPI00397909A8